jgi:hypothetical protein
MKRSQWWSAKKRSVRPPSKIAVKAILLRASTEKMFVRELEISTLLNHDNVVKIFGFEVAVEPEKTGKLILCQHSTSLNSILKNSDNILTVMQYKILLYLLHSFIPLLLPLKTI